MTGRSVRFPEPIYLNARWGGRAESAGDIAATLMHFMLEVERIGYRMSNMLGSGEILEDEPFDDIREVTLEGYLQALKNPKLVYRDKRGVRMPFGDRAFRRRGHEFQLVGIVNRHETFQIDLLAGAQDVSNTLKMDFAPRKRHSARRLQQIRRMMEAVVSYWRPDAVMYATDAFRGSIADPEDVMAPGWITYVAASRFKGEGLDLHKAERDGDAMWFQLTRTVGDDPARELELGRKLRRALQGAGAKT